MQENKKEKPFSRIEAAVNYDAPSQIKKLLDELGLGMRKKYGQNFLVSPDARKKIAALFNVQAGAQAWEIGPGLGAMTLEALQMGLGLSVFEIDKGFTDFLKTSYGSLPNFHLFEGDFLKTWKNALASFGQPELVFGNLPYNIAAAIIAVLIENNARPQRMVFTIQKEVAQRICAKAGTKDYSSFSVLCQFVYKPKLAFNLPPGVFWPQPRVQSSVVSMDLMEDAPEPAASRAFSAFTRQCFSSRRKTLLNNLKAAGYEEAMFHKACAKLGIEKGIRAESISPSGLFALYTLLKQG